MSERVGVQVWLSVPDDPPLVAGIPAPLRAARALAAGHEVRRLVLWTPSPGFARSWPRLLAGLPWTEVAAGDGARALREHVDPDSPLLVLAGDGLPDARGLARFLGESRDRRGPTAWIRDRSAVAAYYPEARRLLDRLPPGGCDALEQALIDPGVHRRPAPEDAWEPLRDAAGIRRAENRLFRSLRQDSDGYLARLDRTVSIALSKRLIRTPVTPNGITTVSLVLGLVGAGLLVSTAYWVGLVGALLLWSCCVLDGCDGEVARLKLLASPFGARYDIVADNIVHLAIFAAIPLHLHRAHPGLDVWRPGAILIAGVLGSMVSVWWLILRQPEARRAGPQRIYERIASRDFIYLIVLLTAVRRLEWFLWSAALGANLFWLSLWWVSRWRRPA